MHFPDVFIHGRRRLGAVVAFVAIKIEGGDATFAENTFERDAAVHRLGCVISHRFIVALLRTGPSGKRCWPFEQQR